MPKSESESARPDRRRLAGALLGAGYDQVFNPSAKYGRELWEAQTEAPAPAPAPGDRPDLDSGRITLTLPPA